MTMEKDTEKLPIIRITEQERSEIDDAVASEFLLTIIFNNKELVTLLCSPSNPKELALGFLASEGLIKSREEVKRITLDDRMGIVRVETEKGDGAPEDLLFKRLITSGCGRGVSFYNASDAKSLTKVESSITIAASEIFSLMKEFQHRSEIFRTTGGVHSAALCDAKSILFFSEDIGRHNALDKIFGECLLKDIPIDDYIIVSSGRISSEMLFKVVKRKVPIVISRSAPTASGVRLAVDLGITLIGFVRGKRMNVYANDWRVM